MNKISVKRRRIAVKRLESLLREAYQTPDVPLPGESFITRIQSSIAGQTVLEDSLRSAYMDSATPELDESFDAQVMSSITTDEKAVEGALSGSKDLMNELADAAWRAVLISAPVAALLLFWVSTNGIIPDVPIDFIVLGTGL